MELYSENNSYKLYHGNMLDLLEVIESGTIDSIVTDPPYELNFMGKGWDNSGIAFQPDTWKRCLDALKPGGYLLAFGGSRTYHRIACAIEDAGFEIRDCIMWLYGSGFPKSLNIGLAIDKKNGVDNRTGNIAKGVGVKNIEKNVYQLGANEQYEERKATNERAGWGTALKPSYEIAILAKKPYDIEAYIFVGVINVLDCLNNKGWLKLNAKTAEKFSDFLLVKQNIEEDIALKNVGKNIFTNEDLLGVMDMLQSLGTENTNLSIVSLCLNFLVEICYQLSKYTTEMKINLITELKILKSLLVHDTLANTIQDKETNQTDIKQSVLTVENFLTEELQKLSYINTHFAQENVTYNEKESNLSPSYEPIIVARKPLEGSCTDNVIKYGVGGINIDECRVFGEDLEELQKNWTNRKAPAGFNGDKSGIYGSGKTENTSEYKPSGRFPANTILTYDESDFEEVCGGFPDTKSGSKMSFGSVRKAQPDNTYQLGFTKHENSGQTAPDNYGDSGSAARYFYCAKASRRDRDEGLDVGRNGHPTIKPTDLMQYLVRLVTPNGGTVLDPFNGSGSTGKAVMYENKDRNKNYKYIGIELTEEYLPIAKARIEYVINNGIEKEKAEGLREQPLFF